ncbi:hypothetical protein PROFUN_04375 [Planoprotostelium fungivorum]|uniref:IPT/TIG domain-containing protein n=1 Tax=Planoprotostelium fungivorum TaxID=1890364 RepID=A0A2P6NHT5_9EUKA|nr:hypothetical protein PROFUN_04375 [Planoprotostelium fungivorum]
MKRAAILFALFVTSTLACIEILMVLPDIGGVVTTGGTLTLTGIFVGLNPNFQVVIDGVTACNNAKQLDLSTITCEAPAGLGMGHRITVKDDQNSANYNFNYGYPVITSVSDVPTTGGRVYIEGVNFYNNINYVQPFANGQPCLNPKFEQEHTKISCDAVAGNGTAYIHLFIHNDAVYTTFNYVTVEPRFTVAGFVKNAVNNQILPNVPVSLLGSSNSSTTSDDQGAFKFVNVAAGSWQLTASLNGFSDILKSISVQENIAIGTTADLFMSPIIVDKTVRAVLNWGAYPVDLDSHYYTDTCEVYYAACDKFTSGCRSGLDYFQHKQRCQNSTLDVDKNTSFGPETVTIHDIMGTYFVYWFPNLQNPTNKPEPVDWARSNATVTVYGINLPSTGVQFTPPATLGTSPIWNVFTVNGSQPTQIDQTLSTWTNESFNTEAIAFDVFLFILHPTQFLVQTNDVVVFFDELFVSLGHVSVHAVAMFCNFYSLLKLLWRWTNFVVDRQSSFLLTQIDVRYVRRDYSMHETQEAFKYICVGCGLCRIVSGKTIPHQKQVFATKHYVHNLCLRCSEYWRDHVRMYPSLRSQITSTLGVVSFSV